MYAESDKNVKKDIDSHKAHVAPYTVLGHLESAQEIVGLRDGAILAVRRSVGVNDVALCRQSVRLQVFTT